MTGKNLQIMKTDNIFNFLFVDGHREHRRDNKIDTDNYAEFCKGKT